MKGFLDLDREGKDAAPSLSDETIESVAKVVDSLTKPFAETYEKGNYPGYLSVLGALMIFIPLLSNGFRLFTLSTESQRLYVIVGAALIVIAGVWISLQNILVYRLQRAKQEIACRMLAIKVAAMGEVQRAALDSLGEVKGDTSVDIGFKDK